MRYRSSVMRYFFILGTNAVLSAAEISALLDSRDFTVTEMDKQAMIVTGMPGKTIDAAAMMRRLGGTIKIGEITGEDLPIDASALTEHIVEQLAPRVTSKGNATFGISIYSLEAIATTNKAAIISGKYKNVGMEVKRRLKEGGHAVRWVKAQAGPTLTSVAVEKNKMIEEGGEFVVLAKKDVMYVGKTLVVQPFEEFSLVDYGRPERDTVQGMLPPKLTRIMINLANISSDAAMLDPFCGSGTVLTEALQMGFTTMFGSDKNPKAVQDTEKNITWLREKKIIAADAGHVTLYPCDAREIANKLEAKSVDAIITEPYLGPPRTGREKRGEIQKTLSDLSKLYYESLSAWKKILKPNACIVIALPVYISGTEKHGVQSAAFIPPGYVTEPLLPVPVLSRLGANETKNHGLLYGRNNQYVWREIVRLRLAES